MHYALHNFIMHLDLNSKATKYSTTLSNSRPLLGNLQQPPLLQVLRDLGHGILNTLLIAPDVDLRVLRSLVWAADAGELWDLARARELVETFGVTGLGDLERQVDEDLDELERRVVALDFGVQGACSCAVSGEGRDEGCDGDGGGVGEELGNLRDRLVAVLGFGGSDLR